MIPVPGKTLCYAHVNLNTNTIVCYNHNKTFGSREELGEHMKEMKVRWLWTHHPLRMLYAASVARLILRDARRDLKRKEHG